MTSKAELTDLAKQCLAIVDATTSAAMDANQHDAAILMDAQAKMEDAANTILRHVSSNVSGRWKTSDAICQIWDEDSRGVYVGAGFVLTAAHCVVFDEVTAETFAKGRDLAVRVTHQGRTLIGKAEHCESISDLALIGPPTHDAKAWHDHWARQRPATIREDMPTGIIKARLPGTSIHSSMVGELMATDDDRWLAFLSDQRIEQGMSGGPIYDDQGQVLGAATWVGNVSRLAFAETNLPRWALNRIRSRK